MRAHRTFCATVGGSQKPANKGCDVFRAERHKKILEILESQGSVTAKDLSRRFHVSIDSIRKDLKELADAKLCRREYGGALSITADNEETLSQPLPRRVLDPQIEAQTDASRRALARRAYQVIDENDTVFLDISRTNLYLADLLAAGDKHCVVTSNMIGVLERLATNSHIKALGTGGYLNVELNGFVGSVTVGLMEPFLFSKAFIGGYGINLETGAVTSRSFDHGLVKRQAVINSTHSYLIGDAPKFNFCDGFCFGSLSDFSGLFADLDKIKDEKTLDLLKESKLTIL